MKLKDFIENLHAIIKENPESQEFEVVYSVDDEGNQFFPINYSPSIGIYQNHEFYCPHELKDFDLEDKKPNSICIN